MKVLNEIKAEAKFDVLKQTDEVFSFKNYFFK
jgi:hypothetical protein